MNGRAYKRGRLIYRGVNKCIRAITLFPITLLAYNFQLSILIYVTKRKIKGRHLHMYIRWLYIRGELYPE